MDGRADIIFKRIKTVIKSPESPWQNKVFCQIIGTQSELYKQTLMFFRYNSRPKYQVRKQEF